MPELPDVVVYIERLEAHIVGRELEQVRIRNPFLLRSVEPAITAVSGQTVRSMRRLGKRIVFVFDDDLFMVLHLMIAGRLRWREHGVKLTSKTALAAFDFAEGSLLLTEAGSKRRASLRLVRGEVELSKLDLGGIEVLTSSLEQFRAALTSESHTLKRALTDPRLFSGIGNAYSDEILHRARMSPFILTRKLDDEAVARLHDACRATLNHWTETLRAEVGDGFPDKVTAFRSGMAVHGRYRKPCPDCRSPVQRIVYAERECNYCATCQTGGKLLADRALSKLLRDDWPKTIDDL